MLKWNDDGICIFWNGQMHPKEKGKKGKDCTFRAHWMKRKKRSHFYWNDRKKPNNFFAYTFIHAHNFPLLILLCISFFMLRTKQVKKNMPTNVLQSCVSKFFFLLSQDFTLLFAFYVFFILLKLEHIETERERERGTVKDWRIVFFVLFKIFHQMISFECCVRMQSLVALFGPILLILLFFALLSLFLSISPYIHSCSFPFGLGLLSQSIRMCMLFVRKLC